MPEVGVGGTVYAADSVPASPRLRAVSLSAARQRRQVPTMRSPTNDLQFHASVLPAGLMEEAEVFWRCHFLCLPEDLALLVAHSFPPGPDRAHFRALCTRTCHLANATVRLARVEGWPEAARMGTTFPQLEELEVQHCEGGHRQARNFLQLAVPRLSQLASLVLQNGSVSQDELLLVSGSLPQLQRLVLPDMQHEDPAGGIRCITRLQQLTEVRLVVRMHGWVDEMVGDGGILLYAIV